MNLNMIRPENQTQDLLLSLTVKCEMLIEQTDRKAEETMEFKITTPRETFSFKPSINLAFESNWMIGKISLQVYNSIFNTTETNNKFELYTDKFDEFTFDKLKDELEEILIISDFTPNHLQQDKIGPRFSSL